MKKNFLKYFIGIFLGFFCGGAIAQIEDICVKPERSVASKPQFGQCTIEPIQISDEVLTVAVRHAPPFIYEVEDKTGEKKLEGIAIDLWQEIADRLSLNYEFTCLNLSDTLHHLTHRTVDIAISPLTITKAREQAFDFSHQYFNSGLVLATKPGESQFDFQKAFKTFSSAFASTNLLYLLGIFLFLLSIMILLALRNIEAYQTMPVMVKKNKPSMVMHVVLYSILNISGIRKDVFGFSSVAMQLFSFLILIFGITVSASLFSIVTASLTQSVSEQQQYDIDKLHRYSIATLGGSTAQSYLCNAEKQPSSFDLTDTWQGALEKVTSGEKEVVLGDWVQLIYLAQKPEFRDRISVQAQSAQFEPYGWGLKSDHPVKDKINQELIEILRHDTGPAIIRKYLGDSQLDIQAN